ncbi:MAG TPA: nucleolar RNA-binding Nop10p family protein [Candidatus Nanoarchaeia archaeon]|nr:nucleolar RNA-binding Nop10p family protein [Candidatus Nanoarchaeia archaeon]
MPAKQILKCSFCEVYTLLKNCKSCGAETVIPKPARWSPVDRYSRYRLVYKQKQAEA